MFSYQQKGLMVPGSSGGNDQVQNPWGDGNWAYQPMSDISGFNSIGDIMSSFRQNFQKPSANGGSFGSSVESDQLKDRDFGKFMTYMQAILGQRALDYQNSLRQQNFELAKQQAARDEMNRRTQLGIWRKQNANGSYKSPSVSFMPGAKGINSGILGQFKPESINKQNQNNYEPDYSNMARQAIENAVSIGARTASSQDVYPSAGNIGTIMGGTPNPTGAAASFGGWGYGSAGYIG